LRRKEKDFAMTHAKAFCKRIRSPSLKAISAKSQA